MGEGEESQFISDVFILCDFTLSSRIRAREIRSGIAMSVILYRGYRKLQLNVS